MTKLKTPEQIMEAVTGERRSLLERVESIIAAALEKEYHGEPVDIWVDGSESKFQLIMPNLEKRFADCGWKIVITRSFDSQMDGARVCFRVTANGRPRRPAIPHPSKDHSDGSKRKMPPMPPPMSDDPSR